MRLTLALPDTSLSLAHRLWFPLTRAVAVHGGPEDIAVSMDSIHSGAASDLGRRIRETGSMAVGVPREPVFRRSRAAMDGAGHGIRTHVVSLEG